MTTLAYPDTLPCPQRAPFTRREARARSSVPGQRRTRTLYRDRGGAESVQFLLTFDQTLIWRDWIDSDLLNGGAWFAATWRLPSGRNGVYRFIDTPSYPEFVPVVGWRVTALLEVRGRGMAPQKEDPPVPPHTCTAGPVWTATVVPNLPYALSSLVYGTRFVAVAYPVTPFSTPGSVIWSDDGVTWHLAAVGPGGNNFGGSAIAYNPATGIYMMIWDESNQLFTSPDGKVWSSATGQPGVQNKIRFALWEANGEFLFATTAPQRIYSTPDGNSAVAHATPVQFGCGCYANGKYYAGYDSTGSNGIYTSSDKVTWTLLANTSNSASFGTLKIVPGAANQLIALSYASQNTISYSSDGGATWHASTGLPATLRHYQDAIYAQDAFLLVDDDGRCYASTDGGATFTTNASDLLTVVSGVIGHTWAFASDGAGLYVAVQSLPLRQATTVAAVGHC